MRYLIPLLAFVLFFSGTVAEKRADVLIKTQIFTVHYSEVYEQPLSVEYEVLCTETKFSRKGLDFYSCDSIKTSDNADYANNEYDKGHMAPAADFSCDQQMLKSTFTYVNCVLQQQDLNRGAWRMLESRERALAKGQNGSFVKTSVKIVAHFSDKSKKLPTGATVPDGFTKVIKSGNISETYYFPNVKPTKKSFSEYKTN